MITALHRYYGAQLPPYFEYYDRLLDQGLTYIYDAFGVDLF